jgi:flagellar motility protein MotE (MotC chaperone)
MEFRLRLVPVAIVATIVLLGVKLIDAWNVIETPFAAGHAEAATEQPAPSAPAAPASPAATTPVPAASSGIAPVAGASPAAAAASPAAAGEPAPAVSAGNKPPALDPLSMSSAEVDLLQKLAQRRAELDKRAAELSQREVVLQAAEKRIDEKIAKLAELKKDIGGIVDKQSQEDQERLKSLVKIYETMKPVDAARIFSQLDMPVLLGVLENMKERNAAPILAAMDPSKAKAVTLALAERRDQRVQAAAEADAPPPAAAAKP